MPVTAKLSSRFHEKLGDDVTNELVTWLNAVDAEFRNELREANDRNWDRLRAELETMSARLTGEFRGGLAGLRTEVRSGLADQHTSLADFRTEVRTELEKFRGELRTGLADGQAGLAGLRAEVRTEFQSGFANLRVEIHQKSAEQLRYMFGFWVTTVLIIAGLKIL